MSDISVSGRIKVKSFYAAFLKVYPYLYPSLRYPDGKEVDPESTIANARSKSVEGGYTSTGEADLSVRGNLKVETFEKRFEESFSIKCIMYHITGGKLTEADAEYRGLTLNEANSKLKENGAEIISFIDSAINFTQKFDGVHNGGVEIQAGRHLCTDDSEYLGIQIAVGKLQKSQVNEILESIESKNLEDLSTFNSFTEINEIFHKIGIPFSPENYSLQDLVDNDSKSLPYELDFETDEYEDFVVNEKDGFVLSEKGFYLITIRFEDFYMLKKELVKDLSDVKIQLGTDKMPIIGSVLMGDPSFYQLNTFWLNDKAMHSIDEEGNGDIYTTYQLLYYYDGRELLLEDAYDRDEMLSMLGIENFILYSNRINDALSIVVFNEDICPDLINEDNLDEQLLNLKIKNLKSLANQIS